MTAAVPVRPDHVCRHFDRVFWSLIEEPDICELCRHYREEDGCCTCPAVAEAEG